MAELEIRDSGLTIVEIVDLVGYVKGVQTTMSPRDAAAFEKAGKVKVVGAEKRPMNKLAPAENTKAPDADEDAEGDGQDGADEGAGSQGKGPKTKSK